MGATPHTLVMLYEPDRANGDFSVIHDSERCVIINHSSCIINDGEGFQVKIHMRAGRAEITVFRQYSFNSNFNQASSSKYQISKL